MNGIQFLVSSVLCLAIGVSITWLNPRRVINQAFVLSSSLLSLWGFCIYMAILAGAKEAHRPVSEVILWLRLGTVFCVFVPWTLWLMKSAMIMERASLLSLIKGSWLWFGGACLMAFVCFTEYYIPSSSTPEHPRRGIGYILVWGGMFVTLGSIFWRAYRTMRRISGVRRIEIQFFLLNFSATFLVIIILNAVSFILNIPFLRRMGPFGLITGYGLLVWAISYHRVFDAKQVMTSLGQRIAVLTLLGLGAFGLTSLLSRIIAHPASLILGVILAGVLAYFCDRLTRKWCGLNPDQLLDEPRAKIIMWARSESDPEKLKALFEKFMRDWCQTDLAELLVASGNTFTGRRLALANHGFVNLCRQGWVTPEHLQRLSPEPAVVESLGLMSSQGLAAVLAVPRGSSSPSLLVALGPKHSLRPYTYPDITLLLSLTELMDNILSHSNLANHAARIAQMESAAMMSRGLAHDLNNLATPVSTFLLHMEDRVEAGTAEAAVLADAKHSIKVMQDYIRESLFFARRLVPEFISLSSSEILSSVIRLTQDRARHHGVPVTVGTDQNISFQADRALIQRLLQNLVFNGIDASRRRDTVEISAITIDNSSISFKVTDRGAGIPAEIIDRIFEPYFTTKDTGDEVRGLGLGLAICRKIIDLHGGKIAANIDSGQGTTFTVILPKTQPCQPRPLPDTSGPAATKGRTSKIESIIN